MRKFRVGMVVAVEIDAVIEKYGNPIKKQKIDAFEVLTYKVNRGVEMCVVRSGAGQIGASATTQFCISVLGCKLILNFGIVGGLTEDMKSISTCVIEKIIHYDFDTSAIDEGYKVGRYSENEDEYIYPSKSLLDKAVAICPELKKVTVASGDKFIGDTKEKANLHTKFGADIVEMESAGIVLTCNRNNVPVLCIKCVSDSLGDNPNEYYVNFSKSSRLCLDTMDKIIKEMC